MAVNRRTTAVAIVAVSRPGAALARRLAAADGFRDAELHLERRTAGPDAAAGARLYDLPLRPVAQDLFGRCGGLVAFLPVGATVRLLAPALGDKRRDAAVVCVDDGGRYAVSLLSGHTGGADALARRVAGAIGAQAVVTSASDALGMPAVDLIGREQGWRIEASATDLTRAAAAVVNGWPVALWLDPETGVCWPEDCPPSDNIVAVGDLADAFRGDYAAALAVSDRIVAGGPDAARPVALYRPPTLVAGIGCRRGVSTAHLRALLADTLRAHGLAPGSLAKIATADIKADEAGIMELAAELEVPVEVYGAAELEAAGRRLPDATPSAAQELLGVYGVAEPAAALGAGAGRLLAPRRKSDRATVAVARIPQGRRRNGTNDAGPGHKQ